MFCSACGVALTQRLKYCSRCGANLNTNEGTDIALIEKRMDSELGSAKQVVSLESAASVTEHTTRTLDPVPEERIRR